MHTITPSHMHGGLRRERCWPAQASWWGRVFAPGGSKPVPRDTAILALGGLAVVALFYTWHSIWVGPLGRRGIHQGFVKRALADLQSM